MLNVILNRCLNRTIRCSLKLRIGTGLRVAVTIGLNFRADLIELLEQTISEELSKKAFETSTTDWLQRVHLSLFW